MVLNKKVIIWDLDNTLYRITPEFADTLDEVMAEVAIKDLGIKMNFDEAKSIVKESYKKFRDGGEIFYQEYGIDPWDMFVAYHNRKPVEKIVPYDNVLEAIEKLPVEQYVFTTSSRNVSEKILKHIGLYGFFKGKYYSVEDFNTLKKNDTPDVYLQLCEKIGVKPEDCLFVDDSYSNLKPAKEAGMTTVRIFYNENSSPDNSYIDYAYKGLQSFLEAGA